jgi:hypothetical protein
MQVLAHLQMLVGNLVLVELYKMIAPSDGYIVVHTAAEGKIFPVITGNEIATTKTTVFFESATEVQIFAAANELRLFYVESSNDDLVEASES